MNSEGHSLKENIKNTLFNNFSSTEKWKAMEHEITLKLIEIPDVITQETKSTVEHRLKELRELLIENGFTKKGTKFIDEEIERINNIKQISLYTETEDHVEQEEIDKYSRVSFNTQGVVGIHLPYNFEQLKKLTNGVYNETGLVKFFISKEKTMYGKITAEFYEYPQKIPIVKLGESKGNEEETGNKKCFLFGESIPKKYTINKEIYAQFYVYQFISEQREEFILLSTQALEIGEYVVTGVVTQCNDLKQLTQSAKIPTKLPYFFVQEHKNRVIRYSHSQEIFDRLNHLNVENGDLFDYPFAVKQNNEYIVLKHNYWFKWLTWAWLLHSNTGDSFNKYPLHLMIVGEPGSGKSTYLNTINSKSKETHDIFSGTSSTVKNLIPSFKSSPAKLGYLAESNRFAFCDEFFRALTRSGGTEEEKAETLALMNDLLEHQKRVAGSGISSVNLNMSARILATTNPQRETKVMQDFLKKFDNSFLTRWLIYFQSDEDIKNATEATPDELRTFKKSIDENDFISIIDYMHSFPAQYDTNLVMEIFKEPKEILSSDMNRYYSSRHKHHISAIMDGIVKTRCLFEQDSSFKAKKEDYQILSLIWKKIVSSWTDVKYLKNLPLSSRVWYLPEKCQYIYEKMKEHGEPIERRELEEICISELTKKELFDNMVIMINNEIIHEMGESKFKLYYMD